MSITLKADFVQTSLIILTTPLKKTKKKFFCNTFFLPKGFRSATVKIFYFRFFGLAHLQPQYNQGGRYLPIFKKVNFV